MSETYKWCATCGACLPEPAIWCRFCGNETTKPAPPLARGVENFAQACRWLPQFTDMCLDLPSVPLKHLMAIAFEAQTDEMKSVPAVDALIGYQLPPDKVVRDLIFNVAVHLAQNSEWERFNRLPRLALIDITADSVVQEFELRQKERDGARRCMLCSEGIMPDAGTCRFCGIEQRAGAILHYRGLTQEIDEHYVRQLLVQIIARMRMNKNIDHTHQEIMHALQIKESELLEEMTRLSHSFCPSWEQELPRSSWEMRLIEADEPCRLTQYAAIRNMLEQASLLAGLDRLEQANLLVSFAAFLAREKETDEFLSDFMWAECLATHANLFRLRQQGSETHKTTG